ncbi:MAG TPA: hypothetical protein VFB06_19490 [Streptosporangiaceae bacterium]|nr:hypothetical protein [Streptosporangiaceae bacterium]
MINIDVQDLVRRYVAVWTEPDAGRRRKAIEELWAADGAQTLQPPEEMQQTAVSLGFATAVLEARGHDALEFRVTRSYEEFIAPGDFTFQPRGSIGRVENVVKFGWEMIPAGGGDPAGIGVEVLILDEDGRIRTDYQFVEP